MLVLEAAMLVARVVTPETLVVAVVTVTLVASVRMLEALVVVRVAATTGALVVVCGALVVWLVSVKRVDRVVGLPESLVETVEVRPHGPFVEWMGRLVRVPGP